MGLQQKIRSIPASPGVYLYKNAEGEVIYVGKAKSLRHRVRRRVFSAAVSVPGTKLSSARSRASWSRSTAYPRRLRSDPDQGESSSTVIDRHPK